LVEKKERKGEKNMEKENGHHEVTKKAVLNFIVVNYWVRRHMIERLHCLHDFGNL